MTVAASAIGMSLDSRIDSTLSLPYHSIPLGTIIPIHNSIEKQTILSIMKQNYAFNRI